MKQMDERWQLYDLAGDEPAGGASQLLHVLPLLSLISGLVLVVGGLWGWGQAGSWSWTQGAGRPEVMAAGIQCGAVAAVAAGQTLWLLGVVNRVYVSDGFSRLLQWMAVGTMLVALVCALALGWAGR